MTADVIILGDSHAIACAEGARALGMTPAFFYASGLAWQGPRFEFHRRRGLVSKRPFLTERLADLGAQLGTMRMLETGLPIIASIGYHLGQIAKPIAAGGYQPADRASSGEAPLLSRGFLEAFVDSYRQPHFDLLRRLSRHARLMVIAPPPVDDPEPFGTMRDIIAARLDSCGISHFDPRCLLKPGQPGLDPALLAEDGRHGTTAYGTMVVEALREDGFFADAAPGDAPSSPAQARAGR